MKQTERVHPDIRPGRNPLNKLGWGTIIAIAAVGFCALAIYARSYLQ